MEKVGVSLNKINKNPTRVKFLYENFDFWSGIYEEGVISQISTSNLGIQILSNASASIKSQQYLW